MKSRFTRGKEVHVPAESVIRFKLIVRSSCKCCRWPVYAALPRACVPWERNPASITAAAWLGP